MMTAGGGTDLFGQLLRRPGFRADLLYFIRLAGNYAASIVIECRSRANSKQKAEFARWLGLDDPAMRRHAPVAASSEELEDRLWKQFLARNPDFVSNIDQRPNIGRDIWRALAFGKSWFDVFKKDFPTLMADMPVAMRERLSRTLQQDHLLPWTTKEYLGAIVDLTSYRHWLEHADERGKKGEARPTVGDERLLEILGLILLPFLSAHLIGRIRHHALRAGLRRRDAMTIGDAAKKRIDAAIASRRETSRFMNGLKRRVDNDSIRARLTEKYGNPPGDAAVHRILKEEAKKRRDLESSKAAMLDRHRRYFDEHSWPRYNHENFLMRFAFIGRRRIDALEAKLGIAEDARLDFINAIEPAFMLAMDMALIIHHWLTELEDAGIEVRKKKVVGPIIPALRNGIAHGDWIWDIEDPEGDGQPLCFSRLLSALLDLPVQGRLNAVRERQNDLLTRLEGALRPCRWTHIYAIPQPGDDPNQMPARHVIKCWTAERRDRFADRNRWRVEKRTALRRMAAAWMRDIAAVRAALTKEN